MVVAHILIDSLFCAFPLESFYQRRDWIPGPGSWTR